MTTTPDGKQLCIKVPLALYGRMVAAAGTTRTVSEVARQALNAGLRAMEEGDGA